jgi:hypothetical protein
MPATPISKTYTPPTCTLEVRAQPSALSRWRGGAVVKSLQFLLSFEGLNTQTREPLAIQGDQAQLSTLTEAVRDYTQTLLASRFDELPLEGIESGAESDIKSNTESDIESDTVLPLVAESTVAVHLRPHGLLTHELHLGELATPQTGSSLRLKVSQLYDLATALEDCTADLQQLPALTAIPERTHISLPALRSAAVVLLTVGLGTLAWRFVQTGPIARPPTAPTTGVAMAPKTPTETPWAKTVVPKATPSVTITPLPKVQLPSRSDPTLANPTLESSETTAANQAVRQGERQRALPLPRPTGSPSPLAETRSQIDNALNAPPAAITAPQASDQASTATESAQSLGAANTANTDMARSSGLAAHSAMKQAAPTAPSRSKTALFDTIPQVAEVRDYVTARWQPTAPLPKTLEYRLILNTDGSLKQVEALGTSAQQYLTQVPLPTAQSPFVSAPTAGKSSIRLVLRPNGTVQTFLDPAP